MTRTETLKPLLMGNIFKIKLIKENLEET